MSSEKLLTVGLLTPLENLDPQRPAHESMQLLRQIFEPPFDLLPSTGEIVPILFDGPLETVAGHSGMIYRGRLTDGLRFSDGQAVTVSDMVETLRGASLVRELAEVSTEDGFIVFTLKRKNSRFEISLTHLQCYLRRRKGTGFVGTGAFVMSPGGTARECRLVRNPHFRRSVALAEIRFKVYAPTADGHPASLIEALQSGEVDLTTVLPRGAVGRLSGVRKVVLPGFSTAMVFFNVESPRLVDPRVRAALAHSIDRAEFAADAYENPLAFTASSLIPRALATAQDGLDYDPSRAKSILLRNGLKPPARLSLLLIWAPRPYLPNPERASTILAKQFSKLGIALDVVRTSTIPEYYDRMIAGAQDLTLAGWTADTVDPCDFLESCLASNRVPTSATNASMSVNNARLRNSDMDRALAEYRAERSQARLDSVMGLLREHVPLVPLMYGSTCTVSSFRVANLKPSPLAWMDLSGLDLSS